MKYIKYVREHFNDPRFPVFKLYELRTVLRLKGISDSYLKRLINYLTERREIKRITKGVYTLHDDITVVGFGFQPFYYGLENALTIRKLWEQGTNPIVMTTRRIKAGVRNFDNGNYVVQHLSKKTFFGYDLVSYYEFWIPVSDLEKTLIDFVYFNHYIRADVLRQFKKKIDKSKLERYLEAYNPKIRKTVNDLLKKK